MITLSYENCHIHESAQIGENVVIGPFTVIGPNVIIGDNTKIGSNVVIKENTTLGKNNTIHPFASIGGDPQVINYSNKGSFLEIGDNNTFHENVTINRGDVSGNNLTKIGNNNLFMACVHVAHDCIVHNNTILVNNSVLAGHVILEDYAVVGANCGIHQFCRVGKHSFLARFVPIVKDVLPYTMIAGSPTKVMGVNKTGLARRGYTKEQIRDIMRCYKIIFRENLTTDEAIAKMKSEISQQNVVAELAGFLSNSSRGIVR